MSGRGCVSSGPFFLYFTGWSGLWLEQCGKNGNERQRFVCIVHSLLLLGHGPIHAVLIIRVGF